MMKKKRKIDPRPISLKFYEDQIPKLQDLCNALGYTQSDAIRFGTDYIIAELEKELKKKEEK